MQRSAAIYFPANNGSSFLVSFWFKSSKPRSCESSIAIASLNTVCSASFVAIVNEPFPRKPISAFLPITSHSLRARSARRNSAPTSRPLTQIRPKFLTEALRGLGSRSRCVTLNPASIAKTACMVPIIPPPTTITSGLAMNLSKQLVSLDLYLFSYQNMNSKNL